MNVPSDSGRWRALEAKVASELGSLLQGVRLGTEFDVAPASDLCASLELLMPHAIRKHHPEWARESLDGVFVARARKIGPTGAELAGTCILIRDQTVTPFLLEVTVARSGRDVQHMRIRLGEPGGGELGISGPSCNSREAQWLLASVVSRLGEIAWAYDVETP